jgi:hypothetical protein
LNAEEKQREHLPADHINTVAVGKNHEYEFPNGEPWPMKVVDYFFSLTSLYSFWCSSGAQTSLLDIQRPLHISNSAVGETNCIKSSYHAARFQIEPLPTFHLG